MKPDAHTTEEIEATIKKLAEAYKVRSLKDFMECFVPDEDVVIIGTGSDEKRIGTDQIRAQVERDWAQTESLEISVDWKSISAAGAVAWAAVEGAFKVRAGGQAWVLPARGSFVLEKRGGKWLIVHLHFSMPAAGQGEGKSV